jgi:hypothetical protein
MADALCTQHSGIDARVCRTEKDTKTIFEILEEHGKLLNQIRGALVFLSALLTLVGIILGVKH